MSDFIAASGPLVWPILILAMLAMLFAARYVRSPRTGDAVVALGAAASMAILALLSVATGFQHAVGPLRAGQAEGQHLFLLGVSEALNGLVLALIASFVVGALLTLGTYRYRAQSQIEGRDVPAGLEDRATC